MDVSKTEQFARGIFCKKREWRTEEEIRVFFMGECKVKIDPRLLTRIILGRKMKDQDRAQIRKWAKEREPELRVVSAYYDKLDQSLQLEAPP